MVVLIVVRLGVVPFAHYVKMFSHFLLRLGN